MRTHRLILLLLFYTSYSFAQQPNFSSPKASWQTFSACLEEEACDVSNVSRIISSRQIFSRSNRIDLIEQMIAYVKAHPPQIDQDLLPDNPDYYDSLAQTHSFEITNYFILEKSGKNWLLSKRSVNGIPDLTKSIADSGNIEDDEQISVADARQKARREKDMELQKIARMSVDLSSPYATIRFFNENIDSSSAVASRIISNNDIPQLADRVDIVEKLDRFLEGKGVYIDLDKVPEDPDFTDSLKAGRYTYAVSFRFSDIYLERVDNNWYLSKESANKVQALYDAAFPFGSDRLLRYLPTEGINKYLGLFLWQYIAILIIIVLSFFTYKLFNWIISYVVSRAFALSGYTGIAKKYIYPTIKPIGLLVAFELAEKAMPFLQLPVKSMAFISISVEILIPVFATMAFYRFMNIVGLYLDRLAAKEGSSINDQLVPLMTRILKILTLIIGIVYILKGLNFDLSVIFGTLSIGGLALALAAQDTIKNFFGSLMIFIDKPFQAGHWIVTTDGIDGTVERVGFRSTRIRTFDNSVITVPNGKLSDAAIDNFGLRSYRRFKTYISLTYDTPPDVVELFIKGLREIVAQHPHTRKDLYHIYMNDMGSHSLNILFYIFFITPEWAFELKYRQEVILSIIRLAHSLGVNFAFPTQTLNVENLPGQLSLSPVYGDVNSLEPKLSNFIETLKKAPKS